jgi:hypothetical protein
MSKLGHGNGSVNSKNFERIMIPEHRTIPHPITWPFSPVIPKDLSDDIAIISDEMTFSAQNAITWPVQTCAERN